jgi:hypothetical protein
MYRPWMLNRLAILVALSAYGHAVQASAPEVSLRSLVEHPQQYEGKVLVVHGFLDFGREGDAICNNIREGANSFCVEIERSGVFLNGRSELYRTSQGHRVSFAAKWVAVSKEDLEPPCPARLECVVMDLRPLFRLRVVSTINASS